MIYLYNVLEESIIDLLINNYMPYTAYVITDRALPAIDGFKPSQRRILYTMFKMGLLKGGRKKSQGIVGSTMFLHPHGDGAIYETMVRMARDAESLSYPYIDSKGNFGKQYSRDMQYASARYTEVRLEQIAHELFKDINKNTVDMVDNYDKTTVEPKLLPVSFPTILVNPQSGIANGMASNIAPFNLNEVIDFTIAYIKNPKETKVTDHIVAPDFPTGGNIVYNESIFENIFETGRGSFDIRATYKIEGDSIIFEELPYTTTFEPIMDKIAELVKDGKLKGITDIHDNHGLDSKGIEVVVKKNVDKEELIEELYNSTSLQSSFGCNFNLIVNGRPRVLGIKDIINAWVRFRANAIKRGLIFERDKKEDRKHLLEALPKVILDIDKVIQIIKSTKKNSEVVERLLASFDFTRVQAEYVADIKLRYLNEEYLMERINEIDTLKKEIETLTNTITNKREIAYIIINQLEEVKKAYGQERKSKLITVEKRQKGKAKAQKIDDYNLKIFITKEGYLKKIPLTGLRGNNENRIKEGDEIIQEFETTNNSEILIFTKNHNVHKLKTYEIDDHKTSTLGGEYLPSVTGEDVAFVTVTKDYTGDMLIGFTDGKIAKIELKAWSINRKKIEGAYAPKEAIFFKHIEEDIEVLAVSSIDKALVYDTSKINSKAGRTVAGVQVMKSKNDSYVKAYYSLDEAYEEADYYRTSSAGIGKYLKEKDFSNLL